MLTKKKSKKKGTKEHEYLFLGLEGSGKTLLIRRLTDIIGKAGLSKSRRANDTHAAATAHFSTDVVPTVSRLYRCEDDFQLKREVELTPCLEL